MALKFLEGFEGIHPNLYYMTQVRPENQFAWVHLINGGVGNTIYRTAQTGSAALGRAGAGAHTVSVGTQTDLVVGFGYRAEDASNDPYGLLSFTDSLNWGPLTGLRIGRTASHAVEVYNGQTSAVLGTSANSLWSLSEWVYLEFRVKFHATAGEVEIRLNGNTTPILNLTGINTVCGVSGSGYPYVRFINNAGTSYIDDIYICDTTGSTNNTFLGPIGVYTLRPTADSTIQLTPSSGSNFSCVDDTYPDEDTSYVSGSTTGHADSYTMSDLPITPTAVLGVTVTMRNRKMDNGGRQIAPTIKVGSTLLEGTTKSPANGSNYMTDFSVFEKQPDGVTAWDATAVNNLEAGFKLK